MNANQKPNQPASIVNRLWLRKYAKNPRETMNCKQACNLETVKQKTYYFNEILKLIDGWTD